MAALACGTGNLAPASDGSNPPDHAVAVMTRFETSRMAALASGTKAQAGGHHASLSAAAGIHKNERAFW
jgi:hypothetical protein